MMTKRGEYTIQDYLSQPARAFELREAEETGLSVRELRERFLRMVNAELRGSDNAWIN